MPRPWHSPAAMAGPDPAYPSGSEEAQFLADSRERSATDWGRKMGFNTVFDPVPGLMGLASGGSPRGSMGSAGSGAARDQGLSLLAA